MQGGSGSPDGSDLAPGSTRGEDKSVGALTAADAERIARKRLYPYRFVRAVLAPPLRLLLRVRREGTSRIPRKGPVIVASNHVSSFDPVVLLISVRRPYVTLAKAGLFRTPFKRWFFEDLGGLLRVDRAQRGNVAAVEAAAAALRHGKLLAIWPQGGRSPTGHLTRGHTGVGRIALKTGAPVYPVAVLGTQILRPKGAKKTKWGTPLTVRVGEPLVFAARSAEATDRAATRAVTDEVMLAIARLMGRDEETRYTRLLQLDLPPGALPPPGESTATPRGEGTEATLVAR